MCSWSKGRHEYEKSLAFSCPPYWKRMTPGQRQGQGGSPFDPTRQTTICCKILYEMVQPSPSSSWEESHYSHQQSNTHPQYTHVYTISFHLSSQISLSVWNLLVFLYCHYNCPKHFLVMHVLSQCKFKPFQLWVLWLQIQRFFIYLFPLSHSTMC